uniref:Protein-tyrosine sulfotransferase n=1 Tax=Acrobeloides nanus TaxID=290746 RepID=A0A914EPX1_9BILA
MRVLLDVHPEIRCGEETGIVISMLEVVASYLIAPDWNENANFSVIKHDFVKPVLEDVASGITRELIRKHSPEETVLCNKDPMSLVHISVLHEMFPKAKFIVMVRDGRGTLHSLITKYHEYRWNFILDNTRNLTMSELEHNFKVWNYLIGIMIKQCVNIGPELCMIVHYERLVQSTAEELERIMNFIGVSLAENQLEHEKHLENVQMNWGQISQDQVINKVYTKGTHVWANFYPPELMSKLSEIAPMLEVLGM